MVALFTSETRDLEEDSRICKFQGATLCKVKR
jgi:hypothetical protein